MLDAYGEYYEINWSKGRFFSRKLYSKNFLVNTKRAYSETFQIGNFDFFLLNLIKNHELFGVSIVKNLGLG